MSSAYDSQIISMGAQYCPSCPASLLTSLVAVESSGNPNATSPAGAQGLFQLMPATGKSLGVANPFDPTQNIQAGETYLQQLYDQYGDWTQALEAYNEGPGNLAKQLAAGTTPTSAGYAAQVLGGAGISSSLGLPSDSSADSSDSTDTGVSTTLLDSLGLPDLSALAGASWPVYAGLAVAFLGLAAFAAQA